MELSDLWRLLAAIAGGAVIGLDRELADKPAGFRTNIMICLGAALFTLVSMRVGGEGLGDRTRIAAQIVTGVGFLGAGAIIQFRGSVIGLTTAATIWAVASVGMAFGAGFFVLGLIGTLLASGVLFGLGYAERRIDQWRSVAHLEVELSATHETVELVEQVARETGVRITLNLDKAPSGLQGTIRAMGAAPRLKQFEAALMGHHVVRSLKRR